MLMSELLCKKDFRVRFGLWGQFRQAWWDRNWDSVRRSWKPSEMEHYFECERRTFREEREKRRSQIKVVQPLCVALCKQRSTDACTERCYRRELGADFFLPPEFLARKRDPEVQVVPPWLLSLLAFLTRSRLRWLFAFSGLSGFVMTTLRVEKYAFHAVLMMFVGAFGQLLIVLGVH